MALSILINLANYPDKNDPFLDHFLSMLFNLKFNDKKSKTISNHQNIKLEGRSRQFSHPIQFLDLSDPENLNQERLLSKLIDQQLVDETSCKVNKDRILPNTYYPIRNSNDEIESLVLLSHGINKKKLEEGKYVFDVISNEVVYIKLNDSDAEYEVFKSQKKYPNIKEIIIKKHEKFTSAISQEDIYIDPKGKFILYPETKVKKAVEKTLWSFEKSESTIEKIQKQVYAIKSYLFSNEEKERREKLLARAIQEQKYEYKKSADEVHLTNTSPVIIQGDNNEIKEIRVYSIFVEGIKVENVDFTKFNYGEALTFAMEGVAALRELYQNKGDDFVQGDLHDGNLIYNDQKQTIGIIDFDRSGKIGTERKLTGKLGFMRNEEAREKFDEIADEFFQKYLDVDENIENLLSQIQVGLKLEKEGKLEDAKKTDNEVKKLLSQLKKHHFLEFPKKLSSDDNDSDLNAEEILEILKFHASLEIISHQIEAETLSDIKNTFREFSNHIKQIRLALKNSSPSIDLGPLKKSISELKNFGYDLKIPDQDQLMPFIFNLVAYEQESHFRSFRLNKTQLKLHQTKQAVLQQEYPDARFHLGHLKAEQEIICDKIRKGIQIEFNEKFKDLHIDSNIIYSADEKYLEAKKQLDFLKEKYPILIFPRRVDNPSEEMTSDEILNFELFRLSSTFAQNKIQEKTDNNDRNAEKENNAYTSFIEQYSSMKTDNYDLQMLKTSIKNLKEFYNLKIDDNMDDAQLVSFFKNYFSYFQDIEEKTQEVMSQTNDAYQLGLNIEKAFDQCRYREGEANLHFKSDAHSAVTDLIKYKVKKNEDLNKVQLTFCISLLEQLSKDMEKLQNIIKESNEKCEIEKERYEDTDQHSKKYEKFKSYQKIIDVTKLTLTNLTELKETLSGLENEIKFSLNDPLNIKNEEVNTFLTETRAIKSSYDQHYINLYNLFYYDKDISVLETSRWGMKSIFNIVTRPFSFVLGHCEKSITKQDTYDWINKGFVCTRSKSWGNLNEMKQQLVQTGSENESLSPEVRRRYTH